MDVASFDDIRDEFNKRVSRIVWCTVTTVDRKDRPRSRILHPMWEGTRGWIATGRNTLKTKHLARNPHVAVSYWDPQQQQVYAECLASWEDDPTEKRRIWELFKSTPLPYGYDPGMIWQGGVEDPTFGVLKLEPQRIELSALGDMMTGAQPRVWRSAGSK